MEDSLPETNVQEIFQRHYRKSLDSILSSPGSGRVAGRELPAPHSGSLKRREKARRGGLSDKSQEDRVSTYLDETAEPSPRLFWVSHEEDRVAAPPLKVFFSNNTVGKVGTKKSAIPILNRNATEYRRARRSTLAGCTKGKGTFEEFGLGDRLPFQPRAKAQVSSGRKSCTTLSQTFKVDQARDVLSNTLAQQRSKLADMEREMCETRRELALCYTGLLLNKGGYDAKDYV